MGTRHLWREVLRLRREEKPAHANQPEGRVMSYSIYGFTQRRRAAEKIKIIFCCAHSRAIYFLTVLSVKNSVALRLCVIL